jgi:hypothetical protein
MPTKREIKKGNKKVVTDALKMMEGPDMIWIDNHSEYNYCFDRAIEELAQGDPRKALVLVILGLRKKQETASAT